jgi:hypothetical protein
MCFGDYASSDKGTRNATNIRVILLAQLAVGNGATISQSGGL